MDEEKTTETQESTEEKKVESTESTTSETSETTSEKSEESIDLTGLQAQMNNISAQLRKGEVDPELLKNVDAGITRLEAMQKPVDPNEELVAKVTALEKQVNDGEFDKKVLEIKTANGLSDSDLDLISDPDLEKFEKRAIEMGNRNKLSNHRAAKSKIPEDLKDNEFAQRFL